jgi:uncharacterized protein YlxW (UPF0749 family)
VPPELPSWLRHRRRDDPGRHAGGLTDRSPLPRGDRKRHWRLLAPLAFVAAGALMVTSAVSSGGTDLRSGRYDDLAGLAKDETQQVKALQAQVATLTGQVNRLSAQVHSSRLTRLQKLTQQESVPAGLATLEGPGLTVTLNDAPKEIQQTAGSQVANAIVHQQDIQAVANALWAGGAEAMTIQGQRVVSTTGIKCVGNTVLLHGVTYSPPYVVSAIGDVSSMRASLARSPYIQAYLQAVAEWQLGWQVTAHRSLVAPAYRGSTELRYAHLPAGTTASTS